MYTPALPPPSLSELEMFPQFLRYMSVNAIINPKIILTNILLII